MTNQEVLTKAIEKVVDADWGGMDMNAPWRVVNDYWIEHVVAGEKVLTHYFQYIYDREFAKALWGERYISHDPWALPAWQYQLQQMVISDDPLVYLREQLED